MIHLDKLNDDILDKLKERGLNQNDFLEVTGLSKGFFNRLRNNNDMSLIIFSKVVLWLGKSSDEYIN